MFGNASFDEKIILGKSLKALGINLLLCYIVWSAIALFILVDCLNQSMDFEKVVMQYADQETIDKINAHYQQKYPDRFGRTRLTKGE